MDNAKGIVMQKIELLFWRFVVLGIYPSLLMALPTSSEVVSGDATFNYEDAKTLIIQAKDHTIIQHEKFSIAEGEKVRYVQPDSSSVVLSRVTGKYPSILLGELESNGKVFLVNPNGVYFGKEARVDVGSLIVSTLDLTDTDYLQERYSFFQGEEEGKIVNLGTIQAKDEGSIIFLSSDIHNEGTILAKTGTILLAAGEKITLDFLGDGLVEFAVEGTLEKSLIYQAGSIESLKGHVYLTMGSLTKITEHLINTDGILVGEQLIEKNGKIYLTEKSQIVAEAIEIAGVEGVSLQVEGSLKTSGGSIHLFAEEILLQKGEMNTSHALGGGEILVGGGRQGKGGYFLAEELSVGPLFSISADALEMGDGGQVILWSQGSTTFNGSIFARGKGLGGNGGFVETSGLQILRVETGRVDMEALQGERGTWLLDPLQITIGNKVDNPTLFELGDRNDVTSIYTISPHILEESNSHVVLSASGEGGLITILSPIAMKVEGVGLTLFVPEDSGVISLYNDITTKGGALRFEGPLLLGESGSRVLDTTQGNQSRGASIFFGGTVDGSLDLKVAGGSRGNVQFTQVAGGRTPLAGLEVVNGAKLFLAEDIVTASGAVTIATPIVLKGNAKIDTTARGSCPRGALIDLEGTVNGTHKLSLESGTMGSIIVGAGATVGQTTSLSVLHMKGAHIAINSNMTASGGTMIFDGPVSIGTDLTLTDTGPTGIIFLGTLGSSGGAHSLTLNAPVGRISFLDTVGSVGSPLQNLTATSNNIQIGQDIILNNQLTMEGPVVLLGDVTITGSTLLFSSTINGAYNLSLDAGASGTIVISNQIGNLARVNTLTFIEASGITTQGIYADRIIQTAGTTSIFNEFLDTVDVGGISLTGTTFSFGGGIHTQNGGGVVINNSGVMTALNSIDVTTSGSFVQSGAGDVDWMGTIVTRNKNITFAGDITLIGPLSLSTGNSGAGNIILSGLVDGAYPLSFTSGIGDLTLTGALGSGTPLEDVTIYSVRNVIANDISASSVTQVGGFGTGNYLGNITTTDALGINLVATYLNFAGLLGDKILRTTGGNIVVNSIYSAINSLINPVVIDINNGQNGTLFVGSSNIGYFSCPTLSAQLLGTVRSNIPCSVRYNGTVFVPEDCPTPLID